MRFKNAKSTRGRVQRKHRLVYEPLEERRLLAADLIVNGSLEGGGAASFPPEGSP